MTGVFFLIKWLSLFCANWWELLLQFGSEYSALSPSRTRIGERGWRSTRWKLSPPTSAARVWSMCGLSLLLVLALLREFFSWFSSFPLAKKQNIRPNCYGTDFIYHAHSRILIVTALFWRRTTNSSGGSVYSVSVESRVLHSQAYRTGLFMLSN